MHTYPCKPIPGDPTDPAGLTALLHRYLIWMETHHYAKATAIRILTCHATAGVPALAVNVSDDGGLSTAILTPYD